MRGQEGWRGKGRRARGQEEREERENTVLDWPDVKAVLGRNRAELDSQARLWGRSGSRHPPARELHRIAPTASHAALSHASSPPSG